MHNLIIPFYAAWLYIVASYYDYIKNKGLYHRHNFINKIDNLFWNVFFFLPVSLFTIFTIRPLTTLYYNPFIEIFHIALNITFGEIWFYSFHYLLHTRLFYFLHKKHHENIDTVGIFALYAHPFDSIVVNLGSIYFLHYMIGFSIFQVYLIGTVATINTIVNSHSGRKDNFHQMHHKKFTVNYGLDLFMDKLFNTQNRNVVLELSKKYQ